MRHPSEVLCPRHKCEASRYRMGIEPTGFTDKSMILIGRLKSFQARNRFTLGTDDLFDQINTAWSLPRTLSQLSPRYLPSESRVDPEYCLSITWSLSSLSVRVHASRSFLCSSAPFLPLLLCLWLMGWRFSLLPWSAWSSVSLLCARVDGGVHGKTVNGPFLLARVCSGFCKGWFTASLRTLMST